LGTSGVVATPRWKRLGTPFLHDEQVQGRLAVMNCEALERERKAVREVAIVLLRRKEESPEVVCYSALSIIRSGPSSARRIFFSLAPPLSNSLLNYSFTTKRIPLSHIASLTLALELCPDRTLCTTSSNLGLYRSCQPLSVRQLSQSSQWPQQPMMH
jgi:hypothetical protein